MKMWPCGHNVAEYIVFPWPSVYLLCNAPSCSRLSVSTMYYVGLAILQVAELAARVIIPWPSCLLPSEGQQSFQSDIVPPVEPLLFPFPVHPADGLLLFLLAPASLILLSTKIHLHASSRTPLLFPFPFPFAHLDPFGAPAVAM